jgi:catechol 2,3-dioxygenase-like lactoylglutathione lyase family enzyme
MFTHIVLGSNDLDESAKFYDSALAPLGIAPLGRFNEKMMGYGDGKGGMLLVTTPADGGTACHANGGTIGFVAASKEAVDAFHAAGLANGGRCEGEPGPRPNAPGDAYGAYLRDPVGNKICAFTGLGG